jgi:hypothetical protein
MPSKQDIAIAKGLAKEAGKMVAEELAKMLIPGIGWFTGMVSVVKLIKALNDPGDESRPVELALRVPQDARFCLRYYRSPGRFILLDYFDVNQSKKHANHPDPFRNPDFIKIGKSFDIDKFETAGDAGKTVKTSYGVARGSLIVGFNRSKKRDLELISTGPEALVAQAILAQPKLKQYETELLAGATITMAALKVSAAADIFDTDMKPNFTESNPRPLMAYGEALVEYAELVKQLGTYPAGPSTLGDPISYTVILGEVASKIAEAFGLELGTNFVTFKSKAKTANDTILGIYRAQLNNEIRNVPGTTTNVVVSMPGSPLERPAATPPPATLPEATYKTTMPVAGVTRGPSVIAIGEDGRVVTSKDLQPIQNTLAPSKAEQQLGKLGLVENVSTASEPRTKPAGATDRSVLVLLAAAAAAVALL